MAWITTAVALVIVSALGLTAALHSSFLHTSPGVAGTLAAVSVVGAAACVQVARKDNKLLKSKQLFESTQAVRVESASQQTAVLTEEEVNAPSQMAATLTQDKGQRILNTIGQLAEQFPRCCVCDWAHLSKVLNAQCGSAPRFSFSSCAFFCKNKYILASTPNKEYQLLVVRMSDSLFWVSKICNDRCGSVEVQLIQAEIAKEFRCGDIVFYSGDDAAIGMVS